MNGKIEQGLHEKLCAYVLGELEGADRAEIERALSNSAELRAERERLEGTIGAVREALGPAETLNPAARDALDRALRPAPLLHFPWLRLAAGIGAVGLGWWIFAHASVARREQTVAQLEESRARRLAENVKEKRQADAPGGSNAGLVETQDMARQLEALGYDGDEKQAIVTGRVVRLNPSDTQLAAEPPASASTPAAESTVFLAQSTPTPALTEAMVTAEPNGPGQAVDAGGTSFGAAGVAQAGKPSAFGSRKARAPGPTQSKPKAESSLPPGSPYRGAGDTVPPATPALIAKATAGPTSPGPSGPSTVGPAGLGTGDGFSAGFSAGRQPAVAIELEKLGYTSSDDGESAAARRAPERSWRDLSPEEQARQLDLRYGTIVQGCFARPNERPRDMFFRFWGDNPFEVTMLDKLSTFSVDVDTASYALARRYLDEGRVPEKAQVRTEEFVNYFPSDVEAPRNATFSVHSDLTPSRFSADSARQMLRVVVRAKDVEKLERQPMHLTFVVDVSGSMKEQNRLETVKHALRMLVAQLDGRDSIALVKFSNDANLVLPMTSVVDRATIEAAIAPLVPEGSTNSNAGLQLGYAQALTGLDPNAVNRVVFLSDGVANVGETDAAKILEGVKSIREKGIYLNTIGVGMNNHNDVLLEQLADKGDGLCNYVDSPKEIQRALVDRFTGAFQPIAKDVKVQVEFDPQQVMRYRLLGYENRAIADADFRNDAVDAGELGAGHQVTALYEIEPTGRAGDGPMATVRLRWKPIRAAGTSGVQEATEASFDVSAKSYQAFEASPPGHRRALIVAQFAEILRRSIHARGESLDDLIVEAGRLQAQIPNDKEFAEFTTLLLRAKDSILRTLPACDEMCQTIDALRSNQYLGAVMSESRQDPRLLQEIEATRLKLEERLRELLRQQAAGGELQDLGHTDGKK